MCGSCHSNRSLLSTFLSEMGNLYSHATTCFGKPKKWHSAAIKPCEAQEIQPQWLEAWLYKHKGWGQSVWANLHANWWTGNQSFDKSLSLVNVEQPLLFWRRKCVSWVLRIEPFLWAQNILIPKLEKQEKFATHSSSYIPQISRYTTQLSLQHSWKCQGNQFSTIMFFFQWKVSFCSWVEVFLQVKIN